MYYLFVIFKSAAINVDHEVDAHLPNRLYQTDLLLQSAKRARHMTVHQVNE